MDKKAQSRDKLLAGVIGVIIFLVVAAAVFGFFVTGTNALGDDQASCENVGCFFNASITPDSCVISDVDQVNTCVADHGSLPIGTLFTIVLGIVFAAAVFIAAKKQLTKIG